MNATVSWTANTESDLAGYQVFHGIASGVYTPADTVTVLVPTTTYTYTGLDVGITHYFDVKAFDTTGNLGAFGTEVSKNEPYPVYAQANWPYQTGRPRLAIQTDTSHMVAGFIADVVGANTIPVSTERVPIGGFMCV